MHKAEFATIMAYVEAGCGKGLTPAAMDVYFDLLGDLPAELMATAARRVLCEHVWATFPSVAELRQAAAATAQGTITAMSGHEAWAIAAKFGRAYDPEQNGTWTTRRNGEAKTYGSMAESLLDGVPPLVVEAMRAFGFVALANCDENFARPQFIKIYESLSEREERRALMPPSVRVAVDAIAEKREAHPVSRDLAAKLTERAKAIEADA